MCLTLCGVLEQVHVQNTCINSSITTRSNFTQQPHIIVSEYTHVLYVECAVSSLRKRELCQQIDLCSMMCGPQMPNDEEGSCREKTGCSGKRGRGGKGGCGVKEGHGVKGGH